MKEDVVMTKGVLTGCFAAFLAATVLAGKPGGAVTRQLTYAGLPAITYVSDDSGRVTEVSLAGRPIISYDWNTAPYAVPMRFFNRWTVVTGVLPDGSASQQVIDSHGTQRASGTVLAHGRQFPHPAVVLDAFATDLGLSGEWQQGMETTSSGEVRLPANGKIVSLRYHDAGEGVRVAESDGKPVLWDIDLPLGASGRLGQLVPSRLIVTSAGGVELAADIPFVDGIESIWSNDASGSHVSFRTPRAEATLHGEGLEPHAEMMVVCGYTEFDSCWDIAGGAVCSANVYLSYCDNGSGGTTPPPDDGSGGGTPPPPKTPQQQQRDLYVSQGCSPVPDASQFLDQAGYSASGLANYFSFNAFKDPNGEYVIVDAALVRGLSAMQSELDTTSLPGLSGYADGTGYRLPGANSDTSCGDHCYGTAVDLNIHNSAGAHDCHIWNALAGAANAAGGWVEPASSIRSGSVTGSLDHFHVAFDGRTNTNYGDACNP
jgi:hypothetical protein